MSSSVNIQRGQSARRSSFAGWRRLLLLPAVGLAGACSEPGGPTTGNVVVRATVAGLDTPAHFLVSLDQKPPRTVTPGDEIEFKGLERGNYTISVVDVPANCAVDGDAARSVTIRSGEPVVVTFAFSCLATTGVILTDLTSSGLDPLVLSALTVSLQGGPTLSLPANGPAVFSNMAAGEHTLTLAGLGANCRVQGKNPRSVSVSVGMAKRDTVRTAFRISCVSVQGIAFTRWKRDGYIHRPFVTLALAAQGAETRRVTPNIPGHSASWSPDGERLIFVAQSDCHVDCKGGLAVVDVNGGGATYLTTSTEDLDPAWSPDGTQIAFVRGWEVMVMNADGSSVRTLVARNAAAGRHLMRTPVWSPDGKQIAFSCTTTDGWSDICRVSATGADIVRLTSDPWYDADPSWSPDGKQLAITTDRGTTDGTRHVAVMEIDGSNFSVLTAGSNPVWTPDGKRLLFDGPLTEDEGLFVMSADGTDRKRVTSGSDYAPAWRP